MSEYQRRIFVPYQNDYEGGPQSPAFTNRDACERHVQALNGAVGWDEYTVEEWPLLDAAPSRVPIFRRSACVHVDGFVCAFPDDTMEGWDYADPGSKLKPVTQSGSGAWVLVFGRSEAEVGAAYEGALREAHAMALGLPQRQVFRCGTACQHPAFADG